MYHTCMAGSFVILRLFNPYVGFSPLISSPFTQFHSSRIQIEKEDRRKQNFAKAPRDDGAWSKIVAQKEAEMQARKESR